MSARTMLHFQPAAAAKNAKFNPAPEYFPIKKADSLIKFQLGTRALLRFQSRTCRALVQVPNVDCDQFEATPMKSLAFLSTARPADDTCA
jgi:hypothetical protein